VVVGVLVDLDPADVLDELEKRDKLKNLWGCRCFLLEPCPADAINRKGPGSLG